MQQKRRATKSLSAKKPTTSRTKTQITVSFSHDMALKKQLSKMAAENNRSLSSMCYVILAKAVQ